MLNFINEYKDIIVNVVSIISIALFLLSVQFKKKKDILIVQTLSSICYMIVYAILGALSGCIIELVEQSKNLVFIAFSELLSFSTSSMHFLYACSDTVLSFALSFINI